ncbi:MAG: thiamine phosphate synthase [Paramuribaculum sp.]|nr:thiamine phosphate synthase [Paramuribaculum sp.]
MIRIAVTPEEIHPSEPGFIAMILNRGWDYVHLRHPAASLSDMKHLIDSIPQTLHRKIRIHGHFEMLASYNIGGIHLNRRCPAAPSTYNGNLSRSCHSYQEIQSITDSHTDYVTLSPVFDSLSKSGYRSQFSLEEMAAQNKILHSSVNIKVIGLGGVTPENAKSLISAGFDGFAVLGYLMSAPDLEVLSYRLDEFDQISN